MRLLPFFIFLTFILTGCSSVPYDQVLDPQDAGVGVISPVGRRGVLKKKEVSLKEICSRNHIDWHFDRVTQVVTLTRHDIQAKILVGSQVVVFDDQSKLVLNDPLRMNKEGTIIVPKDFHRGVIRRLNRGSVKHESYHLKKVRKVIIDAGHGGKDPGAIGKSGLQEKVVVLDIAERLNKILRKEGFETVLTRERDAFISLQGRTEVASQESADLFISIHANSAKQRSVYGVEVFSLKPLTQAERKEKQRLDNQKLLYGKLKSNSSHKTLESILSDLYYSNKQSESYILAKDISKNIAKGMKTKNRGTKDARFFVLRNTLIPAVLVEVGFLSNPKEEKKLDSNLYRQRIARSIAESIVRYAKN